MRGGLQQMTTCLAGRLLLVLLGLWVVLGLALPPGLAQDAVPTIVAGELVATDPEAIYVDAESGGIFDVQPAYARRFCEVYDVRPCATHAFAFLGMPGLLPVAAVLALAGPDLGIQAMRLLGALSAVAAMAVLWWRLAGRSRSAPWAVLTSAVVATPLVLFCIGMGQTSTVLWLSVVLGVGGAGVARAPGAASRALVWATTVLVKATPLALGAVLVWQRRWRMLGIALAVLVALHLVAATLGGWRLLEWFGGSLGAVAGDAVGQADSSGYESVLAHLPGGGLSDEAAVRVAWALRIGLGLLALAGFVLIRDADVQWAFAWSVLVALLPVGWWHYSIVSFGALAVAVARTARPERWVWLPPAFLIALLPMSLTLNRAATAPLGQAVLMAAAATAVYALGRRPAATPSTLNV